MRSGTYLLWWRQQAPLLQQAPVGQQALLEPADDAPMATNMSVATVARLTMILFTRFSFYL